MHWLNRTAAFLVPQRRSLTKPERGNVTYADGKVISSIFTEKASKKREEAGQRVDGELHKEGDKEGPHAGHEVHSYRRPSEYGAQQSHLPRHDPHRVRINEPAADGETNRMEYVRQAAAAEDGQTETLYNRIYPYRSDAESANNTIDVDWYRGRAISTTCDGHYLVMLGHALARNAYAYADRLSRHEHPDPDDPPVT